MNPRDINHRFDHRTPLSPSVVRMHEDVRAGVKTLALGLDSALPAGREKALALTKLEEALFWANAAIARYQEEPSDV